jgi:hypothetical protein
MFVVAVSALVGALLAIRFRAAVLCPAILIATLVLTVSGIAAGEAAEVLAVAVIGGVAALQIGYIAGAILRAAVVPLARSADDRVPLPTL